ncbi:hypothetical protein L3N51_02360 [Metallosphaera sp. J1]|uniref:hypothetical protein n=1 Tax=Metallosphaera javensis (ex Hofmann et al. 2022) TaxID=99938 RepID=UPI001EE0B601|nr:hypothetical protein [Metallosphaera javensis (ex Hofmann et al. 2022)]MCG3110063.1 hypothetical protein [Metallosphaera javensis (ex Hofmann et al. 2022)]
MRVISLILMMLILFQVSLNSSLPSQPLNSSDPVLQVQETGLPPNQEWLVRILSLLPNGSEDPLKTCFSSSPSMTISLPPGKYVYVVVSTNWSYVANQSVGVVSLNSLSVVRVSFHPSAYSEHYQPYFALRPGQTVTFNNLTPSYGPEALSMGAMNSTISFVVYLGSQVIYSREIQGTPFSTVSLGPTSSFGYVNFQYGGQGPTLVIKNVGHSTGYASFNLWSYYIDNFTASLITVPPQFAENFLPMDIPQNNTGLAFLVKAPNYTYPVPLSIWVGEGFFAGGRYWWAQTGFNNWQGIDSAPSFTVTCYSGFGIFSNIFGNYFSRANYVLIPGEVYNFTMEWAYGTTWEFLVNGSPAIEPGILGTWNTTTMVANSGYDLGFEVLTNARAGYENVSSFLSNPVTVEEVEVRVNGTWERVPVLGLDNVGENWYNGWTSSSPGMNLWAVEGVLENSSVPPGEVYFTHGSNFFNVPSPGIPTYPVYGNFTYPEESVNVGLGYANVTRFANYLRLSVFNQSLISQCVYHLNFLLIDYIFASQNFA